MLTDVTAHLSFRDLVQLETRGQSPQCVPFASSEPVVICMSDCIEHIGNGVIQSLRRFHKFRFVQYEHERPSALEE